MCKVLELNGKTEILSFYSVILMFKPHFPAFPFCFGYYLTKFVPRLFLESDIALIFSSGKQFLDNYPRHQNNQDTILWCGFQLIVICGFIDLRVDIKSSWSFGEI